MSRYQNGEYMPLHWDGSCPPFEVVRGHVSDEEFVETVACEGLPTEFKQIRRGYARLVRAPEDSFYDRQFLEVKKPARGAFAVTLGDYE